VFVVQDTNLFDHLVGLWPEGMQSLSRTLLRRGNKWL
jgi:hypothetical protein